MVLDSPEFDNHEEVHFFNDQKLGLQCIVGIHNTNRGPALGGTRFFPYTQKQDAINDVLRLSRAMTYKSAMANLPLGGGKAVIIGSPVELKSKEFLKRYGEFINTLSGRYYTAEDVGTSEEDMSFVREGTKYVAGTVDGSGDPSGATAWGVYCGLKAGVEERFKNEGSTNIKDHVYFVEGAGNVGSKTVELLRKDGAKVYVMDIDSEKVHKLSSETGAIPVKFSDIYDNKKNTYSYQNFPDADVFVPCALNGTVGVFILNSNFKLVGGSANNQLETNQIAGLLHKNNVLYCPDYVINAGGVINVQYEFSEKYDKEQALNHVSGIYNTLQEIFEYSKNQNKTTEQAANELASRKIKE